MLNASESYGEDKAGVGMGVQDVLLSEGGPGRCGMGGQGRPPTLAQKTLTLLPWKQTGDSVWRLRAVTLGCGAADILGRRGQP